MHVIFLFENWEENSYDLGIDGKILEHILWK
jgi:hypothetical protein